MSDCPNDPRCPYCGDTGEWERRLEELDEQARFEAHRREWDPEDMFPDDIPDNVEARGFEGPSEAQIIGLTTIEHVWRITTAIETFCRATPPPETPYVE